MFPTDNVQFPVPETGALSWWGGPVEVNGLTFVPVEAGSISFSILLVSPNSKIPENSEAYIDRLL